MGPSGGKPSRPKKRVLGLVDPMVSTSKLDRIESLSIRYFLDILKKHKPIPFSSSFMLITPKPDIQEGAGSYSTGTILCCEPTSNSDVFHRNFRFWENLESNVKDKVQKAISNLGVVAKDNKKDYSKKITDIKAKDKEIKKGNKAFNNYAS